MSYKSSRICYLDALRIIACFFVLVNHTNSGIFLNCSPSATWYCSLTYFFLSKTAVPLFLMISGAVLLGRTDPPEKNVRRIKRIIYVIVLFSAFYILDGHFRLGNEITFSDTVQAFLFSATNSYWYLYLYLAVCIFMFAFQHLSVSLDKEKTLLLVIVILLTRSVIPMLPVFTDHYIQPMFYQGALTATTGLLFAGYYINEYVHADRKMTWTAAAVLIASTAFNVVCTRFVFYERDPENYLMLDDRFLLPSMLASISVFILLKGLLKDERLGERTKKAISYTGTLTFGIYLLGDWLISLLSPVSAFLYAGMHKLIAVVIFEIIVFAAGAVITAALKRVPGIKTLI